MFGLGPDEDDVVLLDDLGEARVLAKEAVARVDGVRAADFGGGDDRGHVEIGVGGGWRADAHRLIGEADVHGIGIRGRMHRHRLDTHFVARAMNAQRNLATIGDQQFFDRHALTR